MAKLSAKTAKVISEAINTLATADIMARGASEKGNSDSFKLWSNEHINAANTLRELGIDVVSYDVDWRAA